MGRVTELDLTLTPGVPVRVGVAGGDPSRDVTIHIAPTSAAAPLNLGSVQAAAPVDNADAFLLLRGRAALPAQYVGVRWNSGPDQGTWAAEPTFATRMGFPDGHWTFTLGFPASAAAQLELVFLEAGGPGTPGAEIGTLPVPSVVLTSDPGWPSNFDDFPAPGPIVGGPIDPAPGAGALVEVAAAFERVNASAETGWVNERMVTVGGAPVGDIGRPTMEGSSDHPVRYARLTLLGEGATPVPVRVTIAAL